MHHHPTATDFAPDRLAALDASLHSQLAQSFPNLDPGRQFTDLAFASQES
jgi:hypothetical protein